MTIPAAGGLLLDPDLRILERMIGQHGAEIDIGCGTGTLVTLIRRLHPDVEVTGLDPDPKALARARRKAARASVFIRFDRGFADDLPYPDAAFDRVFSSFMFHHLNAGVKERMFNEIRRVLKPGGSLHLLDFGGPKSGSDGLLARLLHSSHRLKDNFDGGIITLNPTWLRQ